MERIVAAAIKFYPCNMEYPQVWTGKRHANILHLMYLYAVDYDRSTYIQGFWTSENRFVDRIEAKKIAVAANQLIVPIENTYPELFSEDVW